MTGQKTARSLAFPSLPSKHKPLWLNVPSGLHDCEGQPGRFSNWLLFFRPLLVLRNNSWLQLPVKQSPERHKTPRKCALKLPGESAELVRPSRRSFGVLTVNLHSLRRRLFRTHSLACLLLQIYVTSEKQRKYYDFAARIPRGAHMGGHEVEAFQ